MSLGTHCNKLFCAILVFVVGTLIITAFTSLHVDVDYITPPLRIDPTFSLHGMSLHLSRNKTFDAIIHHIRTANHTIEAWLYIWEDGNIGNAVAKELVDALERGVKVKLIKDSFGKIPEWVDGGQQSFVHKEFGLVPWVVCNSLIFVSFKLKRDCWPQRGNALQKKLLTHPNLDFSIRHPPYQRNHAKVYIFDEEVLMLSGVNLLDAFDEDPAFDVRLDIMVQFQGADIVSRFRQRWAMEWGGADISNSTLEFVLNVEVDGVRMWEFESRTLDIFSMAQTEILSISPFFTAPYTNALIKHQERGIRVEVFSSLFESKFKHVAVGRHLSLYVMQTLVESPVTVYFLGENVHTKAAVIDRRYLYMGSANFDVSSSLEAQEAMVLVDLGGEFHPLMQEFLAYVDELRDLGTQYMDIREAGFNSLPALALGFSNTLTRLRYGR